MEKGQAENKRVGVCFDKRRNKYFASIKIKGKSRFLGYFEKFEDACKKRAAAEKELVAPMIENRRLLEKQICDSYLSGLTMEKVGKEFNKHSTTIFEILQKNNIVTRKGYPGNKEDRLTLDDNSILIKYSEGKTLQAIAKELNVSDGTIKKRLKKYNISIRPNKKYYFDENFLDNLNEDWKLYFLGLLFADGNVKIKNGFTVSITLTRKDDILLQELCMRFYGNIDSLEHLDSKEYYNKKTEKAFFGAPKTILRLNSKKLCHQLIKDFNCPPCKSLILDFPTFSGNKYFSHFLRGYFDGDGYISKNGKVVGIFSSDIFCEGMSIFLLENFKIESKRYKRGKITVLYIHKKESVRLFKELIYKDSNSIFLARKKERFI